MKLLASAFLFLSSLAFADSKPILVCRVSNPNWNSVLYVDNVGDAFLRLKKTEALEPSNCGLKLTKLTDNRKQADSNITAEFQRGECDPKLDKATRKDVMSKLTLVTDILPKGRHQAVLQWINKIPPDECKFEKFNLKEIGADAEKFPKKKWGQKKASDPKKAPATLKLK
jgi:hypothetical protein